VTTFVAPSWLDIAEIEIGVTETPGPGNTDRVLEYHRSTNLARIAAGKDQTPWCSSFINWCLEQAGYVGTDSAAARSWLSWGMELPEPWLGCITVIQRIEAGPDGATGSATGNHVALYLGPGLRLLGGNQADRVKISVFTPARYKVLGYRWPVLRAA
jgi:uncharacterized protein (TIGR02594 family)